MRTSTLPLTVCALLALGATCAAAQMPSTPALLRDSSCTYASCGLTISPAWNGLAVVSGRAGPRVANLNFFVPRDVTHALMGTNGALAGADSAAAYAHKAVKLRRAGALLTDGSLLMAGATALRVLARHDVHRSDGALFGAAGAAFLVSVPLQFAADGALSRAVWWHNARYSR